MLFKELKPVLPKDFAIVLDNGLYNKLIDVMTYGVDWDNPAYTHGFDSWLDWNDLNNFDKYITDHSIGIFWDDEDWDQIENLTNQNFIKDIHFDNYKVEALAVNSEDCILVYLVEGE